MIATTVDHASLRLSATLLLVGQLLYVAVTLLHTGGEANHHSAIFAAYAASEIWTAVHVAQFACMAIFLAGLFALCFALDAQAGTARWAARFGAVSALLSLALYGGVLAVDGVALKQVVNAWANAPEAEKAARFATAEAIRWLEWGMRSYENFALSLAVLLFAVAVVRTASIPRPVAYLIALSGLTYLWQGWLRIRRLFANAHHRNHRGRGPEHRVDDLAGRSRAAGAPFHRPNAPDGTSTTGRLAGTNRGLVKVALCPRVLSL